MIDSHDAPAVRMRRWQVTVFDFKKQCLFCAEVFEPVNPKHPDMSDRVVQCERMGVRDAPPFKGVVLQYCDDCNDVWGREVALHCCGVHDLPAEKIPAHCDQTSMIDDEAMKLLLGEMYADRELRT